MEKYKNKILKEVEFNKDIAPRLKYAQLAMELKKIVQESSRLKEFFTFLGEENLDFYIQNVINDLRHINNLDGAKDKFQSWLSNTLEGFENDVDNLNTFNQILTISNQMLEIANKLSNTNNS